MSPLSILQGRTSRQGFWTGVIGLALVWLGFGLVSGLMVPGPATPLLRLIVAVALLVPFAVLAARRLNDLGRPWMPLLPVFLLPAVLQIVANHAAFARRTVEIAAPFSEGAVAIASAPTVAGSAMLAVAVGVTVWMIYLLGATRGVSADITQSGQKAAA
ncbi:MAG: DUF805 domain-containing protein [Pseudomonadota bacterium]